MSVPFVSGCVLMEGRATLPGIDFVVSAHGIPSSIPVRWRLVQCTYLKNRDCVTRHTVSHVHILAMTPGAYVRDLTCL